MCDEQQEKCVRVTTRKTRGDEEELTTRNTRGDEEED